MQMLSLVRRKIWLAVGVVLTACAMAQGADEQPSDLILDLFVQKGFVTQQEADKVKAQAEALRTNQMLMPPLPESQWKISQALKNIELFGDIRLRYEDRSAADSAGNRIDLQRFRYAVRVGLRGSLFDDFYYGVRLDTGDNPRSPFVSFGTSTSGGPYQGPFGKSNSGINIGLAYLGWQPEDWFNLTVGKMPNPLYTTPMVWDGDINPEGFAERLKYTVGPADFFATFGQFLYADFNPNSASAGLGIPSGGGQVGAGQKTDNIFMFAWQGGVNYHFTTNTSAKIAATLYNYIGLQQSAQFSGPALSPYFGDPYVGEGAYYYYGTTSGDAPGASGYSPGTRFTPDNAGGYDSFGFPFNQVGLNHLLVVEVPFEFNFRISKLDARIFGDAAYDLEGAERAEDAANAYAHILALNPSGNATARSFPAQKNDVKAYQIGFDLGSRGGLGLADGKSSRRHAWEIKTYWQHIEQYALDPNLLDSDFFEGRENMEGIYVAVAYGFTDNLIGTFRYGHANRINDLLGTGGSNQDLPWMNPINSFDLYQVDLTFKF
jgi:Putative porin